MNDRNPSVALDLLRGLAAMAVLVGHVRGSAFVEYGALPPAQQNPATAAFFALTRLGAESVLVFFVLSGFLVGGQVIARVREGKFDLAVYVVDRATRIFVPLVPALVLSAGVNVVVFGNPLDPFQLLVHVFGLNGVLAPTLDRNAPLWSLAYEIWFYVAGGALGWLFARRGWTVAAFLVIGAAALVFSELQARLLMCWALGALTGIVVLDERRAFGLGLIGAVVSVFGLACHQVGTTSKSLPSIVLVQPAMAETIICLGICLLLPALRTLSVDAFLRRIGPFAAAMAAFSYTLYLIHNPINAALDLAFSTPRMADLSLTSMVMFLTRLLVCLAAAGAFYFCFERNTPRLRRYASAAIHNWRVERSPDRAVGRGQASDAAQ